MIMKYQYFTDQCRFINYGIFNLQIFGVVVVILNLTGFKMICLTLFCRVLIPQDKLTSENSMYWQSVCKHVHSLGVDGDEFLDKVLPNCIEFCQYIRQ